MGHFISLPLSFHTYQYISEYYQSRDRIKENQFMVLQSFTAIDSLILKDINNRIDFLK